MLILPARELFIRDHFFEWSFEGKQPDMDALKSLSSAEQYYLADIYNWDDGVELLQWIIASERCDKGTASLIFWRAAPDFYISRTSETIPDYEKEVFDLLKAIVSKFNSNALRRSRLKFDPGNRVQDIDWNRNYEEWGKIPSELRFPTKGFIPMSLRRISLAGAARRRRIKLRKREARSQPRRS